MVCSQFALLSRSWARKSCRRRVQLEGLSRINLHCLFPFLIWTWHFGYRNCVHQPSISLRVGFFELKLWKFPSSSHGCEVKAWWKLKLNSLCIHYFHVILHFYKIFQAVRWNDTSAKLGTLYCKISSLCIHTPCWCCRISMYAHFGLKTTRKLNSFSSMWISLELVCCITL